MSSELHVGSTGWLGWVTWGVAISGLSTPRAQLPGSPEMQVSRVPTLLVKSSRLQMIIAPHPQLRNVGCIAARLAGHGG